MTTIVTRAGKGSPLTNTEVDTNFTDLNSNKLELGQTFSSATANSVLYFNGSRVVSGGSALTFDGSVFATTTIDTTNLEVTNIKAKDGTAAMSIADSTGVVSITANPILSGGTANGVVYLNASKVATTGSALTFDGTNFATTGNVTGATLKTTLASGSQPEVVLTQTGVAAWSIYNPPSSTDLRFYNGADRLVVTSDGLEIKQSQLIGYSSYASIGTNGLAVAGNVGIGTSSPTALSTYRTLDIRGTGGGAFRLGNATDSSYIYSDSNETNIATATSKPLLFSINTVEKMRLASAAGGVGALGIGYNNLTSVGDSGLAVAGNVGIGTSSPAQKLQVSATEPKIRLTSTAGSGKSWDISSGGGVTVNAGQFCIYDSATDTQRFNIVSGAGNMTFDSSGNLGLGVTGGPSAWKSTWKSLDVGTAASFYSQDNNTTGVGSNLYFSGTNWYRKNTGATTLYQLSEGGHYWYSNGSAAAGSTFTPGSTMTLDSAGILGLGVAPSAWVAADYRAIQVGSGGSAIYGGQGAGFSPIALISNGYISGAGTAATYSTNSQSAGYYRIQGDYHTWGIAAAGSGTISFTTAMTLDSGGSLLVGCTSIRSTGYSTSTSQYAMETTGYGGAQWFTNRTDVEGSYVVLGKSRGTTANSNTAVQSGDTLGAVIFQGANGSGVNSAAQIRCKVDGAPGSNDMPGRLEFYTTPDGSGTMTERARITSGGDLLVYATTKETRGVTIYGTGANGLYVKTTDTCNYWVTNDGAGAGVGTIATIYSDTTSVGSITVTASATAYNTSSDYRLKDNQAPLTGSGAFIDALQPKTWTWKADGSRGVGFIAHEVQEVSPNSVVGEKDGEQMQAMEYGSAEFIANIIAELQSLRARVAQLEQGN